MVLVAGVDLGSTTRFTDGRIVCYSKQERTPQMRHIDCGLGVFRKSGLLRVGPGEVFDISVYQELLVNLWHSVTAALWNYRRHCLGAKVGIFF